MENSHQSANRNGRRFNGQQSLNAAVKSICDIMRRSNCAGALQYVPELTWILFLRILDETEEREASAAEALGLTYTPTIGWCRSSGGKVVSISIRRASG